MADESLYPIVVLIDDMKDEDVQMRLNSIRRLSTIALALGEERTVAELIPYLTDSLDDEDEVLLAVAEELSKFVPLVGGPAFGYHLLKPLEQLAQVEETVVRDKAVESLAIIAKELPDTHLEEHFWGMVNRLAHGDWFASRASACGLFACIYAKVNASTQEKLRSTYKELCKDDTPMVRRSAAQNIGKLAATANPEHVKSELFPAFVGLMSDEQDTVRLLAVDACISFAKLQSKEEAASLVIPQLQNASKDKSWRVRYAVAEKWSELQGVLHADVVKTELVPILARLLGDMEAEVRTQAILRLPEVCQNFSPSERQVIITTNILPHASELVADQSQHVRVAVASVLMSLAPILGKQRSLESLVGHFVKLLKDEYPEVRLNIIAKLDDLQQVIGVDEVASAIVPEIVELSEDPQWRVRLAIIEQLPALAKSLGAKKFDQQLAPLILVKWLRDNVYAIREAATAHLQKLVEIFGLAWAKTTVIPRLVQPDSDRPYLLRLTTLFAINSLVPYVDQDAACNSFLPLVLQLAQDHVPNIRFNAAKTLHQLISKVDKGTLASKVKPALEKLHADEDGDVKYFAGQALAAC
eukprot:m.15421 g.15421  ORF g.15421 m.15421 type:complete len:584 (-) comp5015_c0_seq1:413-2164(-)